MKSIRRISVHNTGLAKVAILVIVVVALCTIGAGIWFLRQHREAPEPFVSGTIVADEVRLGSRYGGRVRKVNAKEGDALVAGQVILELDAAELRAKRDTAAAGIRELEAGARPEEITAAESELEALTAERDNAKSDLKSVRDRYKQGLLTAADRDRAATRVTSLEKSVAGAQAKHDLLVAGTRRERLDQARAQLAEIDAQLSETKVLAPAAATLETLSVDVGSLVAPNRDVAVLAYNDRLSARVYVPETWLAHIKPQQKVIVDVDAFPDKDFEGIVTTISRTAEFTPRNVQTVSDRVRQVFAVTILLPNPQGELRAGMAADVYFHDVPAVPN